MKVILSWYPKVENILRPLRTSDFVTKPLKKAINDRYIELLQIGWFTVDKNIRFRLGYNQNVASMLEYPNLSYILDSYEADLTKDKIQSIDTITPVWFGRPILEHATFEAI